MKFKRQFVDQDACEKVQVWEFFGFRTDGFYIEVGANDPKTLSQTWLLEKVGWRGILIEPLPRCAQPHEIQWISSDPADRRQQLVCPLGLSVCRVDGGTDQAFPKDVPGNAAPQFEIQQEKTIPEDRRSLGRTSGEAFRYGHLP
jgi:hypothetical protein